MHHLTMASLAALLAVGAHAQQPAPSDPAAHNGQAAHASPAADFVQGEVRRIDRQAGKLTIRHGEIRNLDMPPMTMVFGVSDTTVLEQLRPGDRIRFRAIDSGGGALTVTELQRVP